MNDDLFVADFYPELGKYLASQSGTGYDAVAARTRFVLWLGMHADASGGEEEDPVKDYLKRIGEIAPLNAEQEAELARRIEAGRFAEEKLADDACELTPDQRLDLERIAQDGTRAKNHLLEANLRLVVSTAKRYTGRGKPFLDLIQEGNLGLTRAVEKFDYTKGYRFSAYASWWTRQAITRAIASQPSTARIPVHMAEVIDKLSRVQRQLRQDLGRRPTPEELAVELDTTPEKVIEVQEYEEQDPSLPTQWRSLRPGCSGTGAPWRSCRRRGPPGRRRTSGTSACCRYASGHRRPSGSRGTPSADSRCLPQPR